MPRNSTVVTEQDLEPEDAKLATLAKSARVRTAAAEGAAVRDEIGRTYVACTVSLPSLRLTALQVAVAQAVSSGATVLEAAVVLTDAPEIDTSVVRDLSPDAPVYVVHP